MATPEDLTKLTLDEERKAAKEAKKKAKEEKAKQKAEKAKQGMYTVSVVCPTFQPKEGNWLIDGGLTLFVALFCRCQGSNQAWFACEKARGLWGMVLSSGGGI